MCTAALAGQLGEPPRPCGRGEPGRHLEDAAEPAASNGGSRTQPGGHQAGAAQHKGEKC